MTQSMQWSAVLARVRTGTTNAADADYLEAMRELNQAVLDKTRNTLREWRARAETQGRYVQCDGKIVSS